MFWKLWLLISSLWLHLIIASSSVHFLSKFQRRDCSGQAVMHTDIKEDGSLLLELQMSRKYKKVSQAIHSNVTVLSKSNSCHFKSTGIFLGMPRNPNKKLISQDGGFLFLRADIGISEVLTRGTWPLGAEIEGDLKLWSR